MYADDYDHFNYIIVACLNEHGYRRVVLYAVLRLDIITIMQANGPIGD